MSIEYIYIYIRVLISPLPDQEGNKLMFLSEWREFSLAPCLAGKKKLHDSSRLRVVEIARVPDMLPSLFLSWMAYVPISTPVCIYIYIYIQGVPGGMCQTSGGYSLC